MCILPPFDRFLFGSFTNVNKPVHYHVILKQALLINMDHQANNETIQKYSDFKMPDRLVLKGIAAMIDDLDNGLSRLLQVVEEHEIAR